jgi:hypothetical protein
MATCGYFNLAIDKVPTLPVTAVSGRYRTCSACGMASTPAEQFAAIVAHCLSRGHGTGYSSPKLIQRLIDARSRRGPAVAAELHFKITRVRHLGSARGGIGYDID